jgi:hypothetical protein
VSRRSRIRSKLAGCVGIALTVAAARTATAEPPPPTVAVSPASPKDVSPLPSAAGPGDAYLPAVDVKLKEAPSPHRAFTIEWNPLALFVDRFSVNVVIVPGDHHGLVLSPFYTWANTAEFATSLDAEGRQLNDTTGSITGTPGSSYVLNVPKQTFKGFGGEIGYRYYFSQGGPRGFFAGPSLILAAITATAYNGNQTSFFDVGAAADVGFQALIADTVSVSIGGGLQYTFYQNQSIPPQQLPASTVANERVYPRFLLSFGYAFGG